MPSMYAKLMSRITESSLMEEPVPVRYVFMMMLAMADPQGYVIGTDVAIARRMNIPLPEFQEHIEELMKPDTSSNSHEHEGRRVISSDCERGYYVVNYRKYRDTRDEEQRREYMREYMANRRQGASAVNSCKQRKLLLAHAEVEVEGEGEGKAEVEAEPPPSPAAASPAAGGGEDQKSEHVGKSEHQQFINDWCAYYEKRIGTKYPFQGKDAKAAKLLLAHFGGIAEAKAFIKVCHARSGFPFDNTNTLSDIANGLARLQAALAKPPNEKSNGKTSAHDRTESDRDFARTGLRETKIPTRLL